MQHCTFYSSVFEFCNQCTKIDSIKTPGVKWIVVCITIYGTYEGVFTGTATEMFFANFKRASSEDLYVSLVTCFLVLSVIFGFS